MRSDIENKKQQLRLLVGDSYRWFTLPPLACTHRATARRFDLVWFALMVPRVYAGDGGSDILEPRRMWKPA